MGKSKQELPKLPLTVKEAKVTAIALRTMVLDARNALQRIEAYIARIQAR